MSKRVSLCFAHRRGAALLRPRARRGEGRRRARRAGEGRRPLREKPRTLAKVLSTMPYGTRVKVAEVDGAFAKVDVDGGGEGWVRSADLVEPTALTGPGAYGPQAARDVSSSDVTAAGRQLLERTRADNSTRRPRTRTGA